MKNGNICQLKYNFPSFSFSTDIVVVVQWLLFNKYIVLFSIQLLSVYYINTINLHSVVVIQWYCDRVIPASSFQRLQQSMDALSNSPCLAFITCFVFRSSVASVLADDQLLYISSQLYSLCRHSQFYKEDYNILAVLLYNDGELITSFHQYPTFRI